MLTNATFRSLRSIPCAAMAIADFAVLAHPNAPVGVPLEWKELAKLHSANQCRIEDVLQRLKVARYDERQKLPA